MSYKRTVLAGLIPVGFQTISLSDSTAIGLNSTTRPSHVFDVSIETNNARYRADGTDPTLTTGVILFSGTTYRFEGFNNTSLLTFQRSTGVSLLHVMSYRHPGDPTS